MSDRPQDNVSTRLLTTVLSIQGENVMDGESITNSEQSRDPYAGVHGMFGRGRRQPRLASVLFSSLLFASVCLTLRWNPGVKCLAPRSKASSLGGYYEGMYRLTTTAILTTPQRFTPHCNYLQTSKPRRWTRPCSTKQYDVLFQVASICLFVFGGCELPVSSLVSISLGVVLL